MKQSTYRSILIALAVASLSACGGSSGGGAPAPIPTSHSVDITWAANREASVNSAGGGYVVAISGASSVSIAVPFESGVSAAPTLTTTLMSGSYTATVTAYSALHPAGTGTGSTSLPSTTYNFSVPY